MNENGQGCVEYVLILVVVFIVVFVLLSMTPFAELSSGINELITVLNQLSKLNY